MGCLKNPPISVFVWLGATGNRTVPVPSGQVLGGTVLVNKYLHFGLFDIVQISSKCLSCHNKKIQVHNAFGECDKTSNAIRSQELL